MKTFKQFDEIIDLKKVKRGKDPQIYGFIVVSKDDVVIYRGSKWEAEKFLKNKNNAYRLGRKHKKVYNSRQLEVGDKWNPKLQVKFDTMKDIGHMQSVNV
jgi:hypothetical protein